MKQKFGFGTKFAEHNGIVIRLLIGHVLSYALIKY